MNIAINNFKKINIKNISIVLLLFSCCIFLSAVIPPLKSPDEHDHIERAYLLGKGVFVLDSPAGSSSGGGIDTGLLKYLNSFSPSQDKLTREDYHHASLIKWEGTRIHDPSPGTGYYFPAIYLPQAIGLAIGELLGLSIDHSYKMARILSLLTACLLIFAAISIYPINPFALAVFALPMSLFQLSSASLDGVATSIAVFAMALFMRIARDKKSSINWYSYALAIAVVVLTTSRIHTLPMLFLLLAAYFYTKNIKTLCLFFISVFCTFGWTAIALAKTVDLRVPIGESTANVISYYFSNPLSFVSVLHSTVIDHEIRSFYVRSFLGVLGWLDVTFEGWVYDFLGAALVVILLLVLSKNKLKEDWTQRLLLLFIAVSSVIFIFFALLVTWTPHPADRILGVQGRYFIIPAFAFAYSVSGNMGLFSDWRRCLSTIVCILFFIFSGFFTFSALLDRYYVQPFKFDTENLVYQLNEATQEKNLAPSQPLTADNPIVLEIPILKENEFGKTKRIGIRFGTHMRQNPGTAAIVLREYGGEVYRQEFSLADVIDNSYKFFLIPSAHYVAGEIQFVTGGGVSTWELHSPTGKHLTCVNLLSVRNQVLTIDGCP